MSAPAIAERVAAGVAWLDENMPGWEKNIDLVRLDLSSCLRCVLGQLFGEFMDAPDELTGFRSAETYGFDRTAGPVDYEVATQEYADLTAEWRRVISERRAQAAGASS